MKKIAIMFAVAAMMVACGNGAKTATDAQKDSIKQEIYNAELQAAKDAIKAPVLAAEATAEDSAQYQLDLEQYNKAVEDVKIDSTSEAFKAKVAEAVKAFEETLNKPAEEKKEGEQPAEDNK